MGDIPETDIDLFSDAALRDPYPRYRRLRDLGPVVRLTANDMYAFPATSRSARPRATGGCSPRPRAS